MVTAASAGASPASAAVPEARTAPAAQAVQIAGVTGGSPCVALTFDDGPDVDLTPKLLSILEAKSAVATFFVVGDRVLTWPDPVRQAAEDGDEIGNHSWDHPVLPSLSNAMVLGELTRTDAIIDKVTGHDPDFTRAPFGSLSPRVASLSQRTYIAWSIDTLDWMYPDVDHITKVALEAVNGSIVLMHDIHPKTIEAVPGIIDGLRARGFDLVTVSQLLSPMCGGKEVTFGEQVPGSRPLDPFGVDAFQGRLTSGLPLKAAAKGARVPAAAPTDKVPEPLSFLDTSF
jgi:peptidoglycan/xylan/chitin deacetylase (PgdA/CDA1 family)